MSKYNSTFLYICLKPLYVYVKTFSYYIFNLINFCNAIFFLSLNKVVYEILTI